jgi:regulator of protease activity HflC (stomatin/prohibitin superfamily)
MTGLVLFIVLVLVIILVASGLRVVRPTDRGLVERFGKYKRFANPGLTFLIPLRIERLFKVNITEQMVSSEKREKSLPQIVLMQLSIPTYTLKSSLRK